MILPLEITNEAHADIERNAIWWAKNHSVEQAIEWKATVYQQIRSIPVMPDSYPLSPENPDFSDEIRQKNVGLGCGGYRAVFTIRHKKLLVLTVRRGAQGSLNPVDFKPES